MKIFDVLKRLLRKKSIESEVKAIESAKKSIESEVKAIEIPLPDKEKQETQPELPIEKRSEAIQSDFKSYESISSPEQQTQLMLEKKEEEKKKIFALGLTAGYTTRSLEELHDTMLRLKEIVTTKEWMREELERYQKTLIEALEKLREKLEMHDSIARNRFEAILESVNRIENISKELKEPLKEKILEELKSIKKHLPLTSRMREILELLKEAKEMSYEELASRLGISVSALRGLLSTMVRRTDEIERFERDGKGWVRLKPKEKQG